MIGTRVFRHSDRDGWVLTAAVIHGAILAAGFTMSHGSGFGVKAIVALALAVTMCWGCNTVSHIHLHRPLFRSTFANRVFQVYLTLLLAVPQSWWRRRHLAHHGLNAQLESSSAQRLIEWALLLSGCAVAIAVVPVIFVSVYVPMLALGLGFCAIQGYAEHARADAGVDHHGRLYNSLWFNDGFHCAHHRQPDTHWTALPFGTVGQDVESALPPMVRPIENFSLNRTAASLLNTLERATFNIGLVRWFLIRSHRRAFAALLPIHEREQLREVTIVGGGLFPRTVLVLGQLIPNARFTLVDADAAHLARARALLESECSPLRVRYVHARFEGAPSPDCDLLVLPLAFCGDRGRIYQNPPARLVAVHDWLWRNRTRRGVWISVFLLKRLNLLRV
jgi:Fatty acid desaturase